MNTLEGVDTSKVYRTFFLNKSQLEELTFVQCFIHVDLVNWLRKILAEHFERTIKIIYKQLHHFDINHIRCVEIYHNHNDYTDDYFGRINRLLNEAQYKMLWRSKTSYYVRNTRKQQIESIEKELQDRNLCQYLIAHHEMKIDWFGEHKIHVFDFKTELTDYQILELDKIFSTKNQHDKFRSAIFISYDFLFLKSSEPPRLMKTEILTTFHGKILNDLKLEDLLALELANKDHRIPYYDPALHHDIRMLLKQLVPSLYSGEILDFCDATQFVTLSVLKYFIYKYRKCFRRASLPNQRFARYDIDLIKYEHRTSLKIVTTEYSSFVLDIISPENEDLLTVDYSSLQKRNECSINNLPSNRLELKFKADWNLEFADWKFLEIVQNSIADINKINYLNVLFRMKKYPAGLRNFLEKDSTLFVFFYRRFINPPEYLERFIIRLTSVHNYLNNSITRLVKLNIFKYVEFEVFKITIHLQRLLKMFNKVPEKYFITFIECAIKRNRVQVEMRKIKNLGNNSIRAKGTLVFKDMSVDTEVLILLGRNFNIICNNCTIMESARLELDSWLINSITFENMNIQLNTIASILQRVSSVTFKKCEIQLTPETLSKDYSHSRSVNFYEMDIDILDLIEISNHFKIMLLQQCRIVDRPNEIVAVRYDREIFDLDNTIIFQKMEIEVQTLFNISYKFTVAHINNCQILDTYNFQPKFSIQLYVLTFGEMCITPQVINSLNCLEITIQLSFSNCEITNKDVLQIWNGIRHTDCELNIQGKHDIDAFIYPELVDLSFEHNLDDIFESCKNGISIVDIQPVPDIDWSKTSFSHINWDIIKIRSFKINDHTIKLEYFQNDEIFDLFDDQNNLLN